MKEFDKWFYSHRSYGRSHTCQTSRGENLAHLHDEEVWRAALEWALNDLEEQYERLCDTFECGWFGGTIEDELKDK